MIEKLLEFLSLFGFLLAMLGLYVVAEPPVRPVKFQERLHAVR